MLARIFTISLSFLGFMTQANAQTLPAGCFSGSVKSFYHYYNSSRPDPVGKVFREGRERRTLCITARDDAYIASNPAGLTYTVDEFVPRSPGVSGGYFSGPPILVDGICTKRFEIRLNSTMRGIRYEQRVLSLCHDADAVEIYAVFSSCSRATFSSCCRATFFLL